MTLVRCYLPLTPERLVELRRRRRIDGALEGYAVTESVRRSDPGGDAESWEYAALQDAAHSLVQAGAPVIVAAVDVDRAQVDDRRPTGSQVTATGPLTLPRFAAFHVGDDVLQPDRPESPDDVEVDLSWFDTTELDHLVDVLRGVHHGGEGRGEPAYDGGNRG